MGSTLNVTEALKNPGQGYPFSAELELEDMVVLDDPVHFESVHVEGTVLGTGESINAVATAEAVISTRCSKCLEPMQLNLKAELDVHFMRMPDPEDPDLYAYDASTIDLTDPVRDALTLEMPMRFLCREDCKGLCPHCGANLNEVTCTCQEGGEVANPFAALKAMVQNDEEV